MSTENAFAELGLAPDATEREVKAAWRRLASQWHPDRNESAGAIAKMQRINQAFEQIRRAGFTVRTAAPAAAADMPGSTNEGAPDGFDPDLDTAASQAAGTQRPRRTLHRRVRMSLEEAAVGCIKVLRGKVTDHCGACAGAGHEVLGGHCKRCGGSGAMSKQWFFGWSTGASECDECLGGGIARRPCASCDGDGKKVPRPYKMNVRIPHGVRHGDLLHVDGERAGALGPGADVEIRIEMSPHAFFELDDDGTVRFEMPVDGFAWIANRPLRVPTVTGFQTLRMSRDQLAYRLEGQGFPIERRGPRGDQLITLAPVFPQQLSTDQHILLDQLLATGTGADGGALDDPLRAWNHGLRNWERGL